MPVPVPRHSKPEAHPVVKRINCGDGQTIPFQNISRTLPVSPIGPPPSFGTREQWINSLPSWRRTKPRRIWEDDTRLADQRVQQDFYRGLTGAGNASVIKGAHAEACIPPLYTLLEAGQPPAEMQTDSVPGSGNDADDEMSSDYSTMDRSNLENQSQWSASSPIGNDDVVLMEDGSQARGVHSFDVIITDLSGYEEQPYERGAFTPVFEDQSPDTTIGQDGASSPLEPITPFGEYVDRAVASAQSYLESDGEPSNNVAPHGHSHQERSCGLPYYPVASGYGHASEQPKEPAPAPEVVTPSATVGYKKLAEPLSEWVANYVWKVCTTGLSLPSVFARPSTRVVASYPNLPPSYLAASVHSLLLSTLLQPSAVILAMWYIVRLPVYFAAAALGPEHAKEARLRAVLLGDPHTGYDQEATETSAPFRLIVLGCMLANKWLDDHTFSNKTWHNISNVPIKVLNKLESLTLDIFCYDLTVPSRDWSQWLTHVMSYHLALATPAHPQPISRPSTSPHSIIRKVIDEIIKAPVACNATPVPQPVFLGLEERKREKLEKEQAMAADVLEIDLDEDGPLREEYLPKRRTSGANRNTQIVVPPTVIDHVSDSGHTWEYRRNHDLGKPLPPPAKWSPAGDEPILRERNRTTGQYVAVQPPVVHNVVSYPASYHPSVDIGIPHVSWNDAVYPQVKPQAHAYAYGVAALDVDAAYYHYPLIPPIAISHSRSHSLSLDQDNTQSRNHMRSYSQSRFEYKCSDIRLTANELAPQGRVNASWMGSGLYPYHAHAFAPIHNVRHYQSTWLRT